MGRRHRHIRTSTSQCRWPVAPVNIRMIWLQYHILASGRLRELLQGPGGTSPLGDPDFDCPIHEGRERQ